MGFCLLIFGGGRLAQRGACRRAAIAGCSSAMIQSLFADEKASVRRSSGSGAATDVAILVSPRINRRRHDSLNKATHGQRQKLFQLFLADLPADEPVLARKYCLVNLHRVRKSLPSVSAKSRYRFSLLRVPQLYSKPLFSARLQQGMLVTLHIAHF